MPLFAFSIDGRLFGPLGWACAAEACVAAGYAHVGGLLSGSRSWVQGMVSAKIHGGSLKITSVSDEAPLTQTTWSDSKDGSMI